MLVTNIYNMADTYFVSTVGTSATGAVGIVFELMAILQAFGFMFGHGAGANISRRLGTKRVEEARIFASTSFFGSLFFGALIAILGLTFLKPLMYLMGSTSTILPYARAYAFFILIAAMVNQICHCFYGCSLQQLYNFYIFPRFLLNQHFHFK